MVDITLARDDSDDLADPDTARAGAAVAARRRDLGLTQRRLARDKIINAGALIAFEKGRSWPHAGTRARLERVLRWPPDAIAAIRDGAPSPVDHPSAATVPSATSPLIAQTIQLALHSIDTVINSLPVETAPDFTARSTTTLNDLRKLQIVATDAARSAPDAPALVVALGGIRRRYDELMARAAKAPDAPVGRRLYDTRRRANLTVEDAALATGLPTSIIAAAEADKPLPEHTVAAIESVLDRLEREPR